MPEVPGGGLPGGPPPFDPASPAGPTPRPAPPPGGPAGSPSGSAPPPGPFHDRRPLWDEVDANRWKSVLLLVSFVALVVALGYVFGRTTALGPAGPVLALIVAGFLSFGSWYYSDRLVLAASHARPVDASQNPYLVNVVEGLAIAAGLPAPKIYLIDDTAPNAFATGRNPQHAAIAVTTGLLEKLNRSELEGVIAHEMSHVKNYDIRMVTLAAVLVGTVALMSDWALRSMRWGMWGGRSRRDDRSGAGGILAILALVLAILAPIAAQLLQLALSRRREFLADSNGALLTRYPEGLASALEKISADREPLEVANRATAPLYIVNPLLDYQGHRVSLFDTHPPIEERIRRLRSL